MRIQKPIHFYIVIFITLLITSCGSDDDGVVEPVTIEEPMVDPVSEDPAEVLASERQTVLDDLTNTSQKVWKITEAILTNNSGTFDISTNFNVIDDELIFINSVFEGSKTDFNGTLEWRGGNAIYTEATTLEETLVDLYESPFKSAFDFVGDSSTNLESAGFTFEFIDENTITGIVQGEGSSSVAIQLAPKTSEDYVQIPSNPLNFSTAFSYSSNGVSCCAPGMVGSNSSNSIYIVTRENGLIGTEDANPERVTKFDIGANQLTDKLFFQNDFVSKQLHIIDNQLKVVGGQFINTYELDLQADPTSASYNGEISLSRHGSAVIDDDIYIVGGPIGGNNIGNEIYKWDDLNSSLEIIVTLPENVSGARADIVQNKLYVFGGTEEFFGNEAKNTIYIYDFETGNLSTEMLPQALHFSYTGKQENLIYVAGQVKSFSDDPDGDGIIDDFLTPVDNEPYIGVYDTNTGEFTELQTNLSSQEMETIHSMAIINGKMYVIYGQFEEVAEGEFQNWNVMVADLD